MFRTKVKVALTVLSVGAALLLPGASADRAFAKRAPLDEKKKVPGLLFKADVEGPGRVAFAPDGKTVTWASRNGAYRTWDAAGKEVQKWEKKGLWSILDLSANGKVVAVREKRNTVHLLNTASGKDVCVLDGDVDFYGLVNAFALSPDGRLAAANFHGGEKGYRVRIWDAVTGKEQVPVNGPEHGYLRCMAFSADNKLMALGLDGTDIELYDLATRKQLLKFGKPRPVLPEDGVDKRSPSRLVCILSVAFSPDGKTLAAGNNDGGIDLYAVATGKHLQHLGSGPRSLKDFHVAGVGALTFSQDGKTLLSVETFLAGRGVRKVELWDLTTGKKLPVPSVAGSIYHAALSPDGKKLAVLVVEEDKGVVKAARVEVWELAAEKK
jgi:WD40 repeat protein